LADRIELDGETNVTLNLRLRNRDGVVRQKADPGCPDSEEGSMAVK
jgi:hypothetical protein